MGRAWRRCGLAVVRFAGDDRSCTGYRRVVVPARPALGTDSVGFRLQICTAASCVLQTRLSCLPLANCCRPVCKNGNPPICAPRKCAVASSYRLLSAAKKLDSNEQSTKAGSEKQT